MILAGEAAFNYLVKGTKALWALRSTSKATTEVATTTVEIVTKNGINFTKTAASHMDDVSRMIPVQTLDDIIKTPLKVMKDPQGSNALMHYSQMTKNGKLYNVEVLYEKTTNTIMHFKYTQKQIGPLQAITK